MARIDGAPARGLFVRLVYFMTRRKVGRVVTPIQVTAHHRTLLFGYGMMEQAQMSSRRVDAALKSLASIRVATLVGCPF